MAIEVGKEYVSIGPKDEPTRVEVVSDEGDHWKVKGKRLPANVILKSAAHFWKPA